MVAVFLLFWVIPLLGIFTLYSTVEFPPGLMWRIGFVPPLVAAAIFCLPGFSSFNSIPVDIVAFFGWTAGIYLYGWAFFGGLSWLLSCGVWALTARMSWLKRLHRISLNAVGLPLGCAGGFAAWEALHYTRLGGLVASVWVLMAFIADGYRGTDHSGIFEPPIT